MPKVLKFSDIEIFILEDKNMLKPLVMKVTRVVSRRVQRSNSLILSDKNTYEIIICDKK
jgi:hypothetical protein